MNTAQQKMCAAFLDEFGKVKQLPVKGSKRIAVLAYLAEKFAPETDYTEKQVNAILDEWHTFGDFYLLRRCLVDYCFLGRVNNCSRYWRQSQEQLSSNNLQNQAQPVTQQNEVQQPKTEE